MFRLAVMALAFGCLLACDHAKPQIAQSTGYDAQRCGGFIRGWHNLEDFRKPGDRPMHNDILLKHNNVVFWNQEAVSDRDLTKHVSMLEAFPGLEPKLKIENGADCKAVKALRSKLDAACRAGGWCYEFNEAEWASIQPPLPPEH
jgi:hypothetical protein